MIAADTSSLVAFFHGEQAPDVGLIDAALSANILCMAPPVVSELLSRPVDRRTETLLAKLEPLPVLEGYWERAGRNRGLLLAKGLKARLADALIAQCCIDADVALITRDADYRHFATWCGLKLAL